MLKAPENETGWFTAMGTVVVVGSYNRDLLFRTAVLPAAGQTRLGEMTPAHGGKGFNQAVAAARLGAEVRFVGAIGDDAFSRDVQMFADDEGIDARWQLCEDAPTGMASVTVDAAGQNQIVVAAGANARLSAEHVSRNLADLDEAVVVVQLETSLDSIRAALGTAEGEGWPSILNPAPVHPDLTLEDVRRATILTPNESELSDLMDQLLGATVTDEWSALDDEEIHGWCRRLGVDTVVLTLGEDGCFVSHQSRSPYQRDDDSCYRVSGIATDAVDTTGAGDCFNGALAAGLIRFRWGFRRACRFANLAASVSVGRHGATPSMPKLVELPEKF